MNPRSSQAGFTFLELLFALGFFMIGLYGTVGIQMAIFNGGQRASDVTIANNLATSMIEELLVRDMSTAGAGETQYFDPYGAPTVAPGFFAVQWQDVTTDVSLPYYDIQVDATWLRKGEVVSGNWSGHRIRLNTRIKRP